jgi:hypothetical protein
MSVWRKYFFLGAYMILFNKKRALFVILDTHGPINGQDQPCVVTLLLRDTTKADFF